MTSDRNNLKAGLFVLIGIVLGFGVILVLAWSNVSEWMTSAQTVTVRFALRDGLRGLKEGSIVTVGDVPAGTVQDIRDDVQGTTRQPGRIDQSGLVVAKLVDIELPAKYKLYDNAVVELVVPPLGSGTRLNIASFGYAPQPTGATGEPPAVDLDGHERVGDRWRYEPGEVIPGELAGSQLTASLVKDIGIGEMQRQQIRQIIADVQRLVAAVAEKPEAISGLIDSLHATAAALERDVPKITGPVAEKMDGIVGNVDHLADEADSVVTRISGRADEWLDRISSVTASADAIMTRVEGMVGEDGSISRTIDEARTLLSDARQVVGEENRQQVSATLSNLETTTSELRALVVTQRPVLERLIANARLTSDQLKLAAIEVRRSPWRLLYKPSEKEVAHDNLYDAARSYALAAGALETTSETLRALLERFPETLDEDDHNLKLMLDHLHLSMEQFIKAEKRFWEALEEEKPE